MSKTMDMVRFRSIYYPLKLENYLASEMDLDYKAYLVTMKAYSFNPLSYREWLGRSISLPLDTPVEMGIAVSDYLSSDLDAFKVGDSVTVMPSCLPQGGFYVWQKVNLTDFSESCVIPIPVYLSSNDFDKYVKMEEWLTPTRELDPVEEWMFKCNLEYIASEGVEVVVDRLRSQGYIRVADAVQSRHDTKR